MNWFQALVIGVVQGITEFLPISSTAHVRIVPELLGWQDPGAAFTAVIQLGTLLAVLVYFRKDIDRTFIAWISGMKDPTKRGNDYRLGWAVFLGSIPVMIFGFMLRDAIGGSFRSLYVIAWSLIGLGIVLAIAEKVAKHVRPISDVTSSDGIIVGMFQAMALVPGVSRSGSTITGALFLGFDRETAARLSFLLSIPAILIAGVFELVSERHALQSLGGAPILIATVAAFVSGYISIEFLLRFLRTKSTLVFSVYRILLGALLLYLLSSGVLRPLP